MRVTQSTCVESSFWILDRRRGQTIIEFREELLSLIEEADGDNIGVNNLICMMLHIGASDPAPRRELGSIKNPTLIAFNDKIEGFEQARKNGVFFRLWPGCQRHSF